MHLKRISHRPKKLINIFDIDIKKDPCIVEGYFLTKKIFKKHKMFIKKNIGPLNFEIFEYCLRQYEADDFSEIRKLYKEDFME